MSIQEISNTIDAYESGVAELNDIAYNVSALTQLFIHKQLSGSEYKELLEDIQLEGLVLVDSVELVAKEDLRFIIDSAITLLKTAKSAI